jgi:hypothetical protein
VVVAETVLRGLRLLQEFQVSAVVFAPRAPSSKLAVPQMVRNALNRCREFDWVNGLRDMRLKSCREDSSPIFGTRVARQRDRGEKTSMVSFILPNLSDQLIPIVIR